MSAKGIVIVTGAAQGIGRAIVVRLADDGYDVAVMIANAGVGSVASVFDLTAEELDRVYAVNVRGTFLCYKYAAIQMVTQGRGGRIVGACSTSGKKAKRSDPLSSAYCASKFAVRALTQSAASELGRCGITVNAYAPGATLTPFLDEAEEKIAKLGLSGGRDAFFKSLEQRTVVGYNGSPKDVASLVSFIVSKEAHFITGQSILCDGGYLFD